MGTKLSRHRLEVYRQQGFLFPLPALSNSETAILRTQLEGLEAQHGGKLPPHINRKPHLLLTWLNELIQHPRILDAVEQILGPDILCWGSGFFIKNPLDKARVTWHQDSTYWGLSSPDITTAWIALTPSTTANGCMRVVPETHMLQQLPHEDTFAPDNLLSRGQEIAVEVNESKAVDIVLKPGQMSLHHVLLVHGSERLADSATLVRGSDHYRHFLPEPGPSRTSTQKRWHFTPKCWRPTTKSSTAEHQEVEFSLGGPGVIAAVGNGDAQDPASYQGNRRKLYQGCAAAR